MSVCAFPKGDFFPASLPVTCMCRVHPRVAPLVELHSGQVSLLIVFVSNIKDIVFSFHIC